MRGSRTPSAARRRLRTTVLAGVAGGLLSAALGWARSRARRRREEGEQAFSRASAGMWPPVPPAPAQEVRIVAERASDSPEAASSPDTTATTDDDEASAATGA